MSIHKFFTMHRPKPAFMLVVLAGAVALISCRGDEDSQREKKRAVKPAVSPAKPNPAPQAVPVRPAMPKPGGATQTTSPAAVPVKPSPAHHDTGAPTANRALGKATGNEPVDLGKNENKTITFTSGKPVVTDTPEDKAAIKTALKDFAEAAKGVTFGPPKKKPAPAPAPPRN
jgi:hypothetical protein